MNSLHILAVLAPVVVLLIRLIMLNTEVDELKHEHKTLAKIVETLLKDK